MTDREYVHGRDCTDCGSELIHPDCSHYCRRCATKNGERSNFYMIVDRDKVRDYARDLKEEEAIFKILDACLADSGTVFID